MAAEIQCVGRSDRLEDRATIIESRSHDVPNMVDAYFVGDHGEHGWVRIDANDKGRACVDALFPKAHIAWREPSERMPPDWHGFIMNIPNVVAEIETALPMDITRGADLDEANPDALALEPLITVTFVDRRR
jgi:hypothetical protein